MKSFNFINHNLPEIEQVTLDTGRYYVTPEGNHYPSVTSILGVLSAPYINEWRDKIGHEEADRISKAAADRGTKVHARAESYLRSIPYKESWMDIEDSTMFKSMIPELNKFGNIHALETRLYSDKLRVAGTVDCIAEIDSVLYIIDFKTSSRFKNREEIDSYFMQTACYAYCWWERTGIPITQTRIIMTTTDSGVLVYDEPVRKWLPKFIEHRNSLP